MAWGGLTTTWTWETLNKTQTKLFQISIDIERLTYQDLTVVSAVEKSSPSSLQGWHGGEELVGLVQVQGFILKIRHPNKKRLKYNTHLVCSLCSLYLRLFRWKIYNTDNLKLQQHSAHKKSLNRNMTGSFKI